MLYGVNQRLRVEDVDSPLCDVRPVKTVLLVAITGDRGLCGGYNNFIIKKVGGLPGCLIGGCFRYDAGSNRVWGGPGGGGGGVGGRAPRV
jgi:hypothetical protein